MLSGGECGIWSIIMAANGCGCGRSVWFFLACAFWIYAAVALMHIPTKILYRYCRVEYYVVANCTEFVVFLLPRPANSMAWPGGKKAVTGYSMPLQERENAATRGQQKVKMYYVYMLQGRASARSDLASSSTHPEKGILVDFPVLPKSYVPPPSTQASRAS